MRRAKVLYKGMTTGILQQNDNGSFEFRYAESWLSDTKKTAISLTFPKSKKAFLAENLFSFFYHLLPEGANKRMVCREHKIDESDAFGIFVEHSKNGYYRSSNT